MATPGEIEIFLVGKRAPWRTVCTISETGVPRRCFGGLSKLDFENLLFINFSTFFPLIQRLQKWQNIHMHTRYWLPKLTIPQPKKTKIFYKVLTLKVSRNLGVTRGFVVWLFLSCSMNCRIKNEKNRFWNHLFEFRPPYFPLWALRNMWTIPKNFKILAVILYENLIDRETKNQFDETSTFSSFEFSTENVKASKWFACCEPRETACTHWYYD